jgi:methylase of polypeptide subunit release factors
MTYQLVRYDPIEVCYTPDLDGGGLRYGQDYLRLVEQKFGRVGRVFEWCAGPGFIGFSLLARGLCDSLALADINPHAVAACRATIERNGLHDRVAVYQAGNLAELPATEHWDLVVGNPPHSGSGEVIPRLSHRLPVLYMDKDWLIHRRFYAEVRQHLEPSSWVVLVENSQFSSVADFAGMIRSGELELTGTERCPYAPADYYYYILCRPRPA